MLDARTEQILGETIWNQRHIIAEETAAGRPVIVLVEPEAPWCTCNHMGVCLGCMIEKKVKELYGTQGLAHLLAHLKEGDP